MNLVFEPIDQRMLESAFAEVEREVDRAVRRGLSDGARKVSAEARANHDYKDGPKKTLTSSIGAHPAIRISAQIWEALVSADAPHAAAIEEGAAPHGIAPKSKSKKAFLTFKVNGVWVRTKFVFHPGNRAYRFLSNAAERKANDVADAVELATLDAFRRVGFDVRT